MTKSTNSLGALIAARAELEAQIASVPKADLIAAAREVVSRPELAAAAKDLAVIVAAMPDDEDRRAMASLARVLASAPRLAGRASSRAEWGAERGAERGADE